MKVGIIGGGASGMMAAIKAASLGAQVTLFEKNDRVGKKILVTGNGRCNFTNLAMSEHYYYTDDDEYLKEALSKFSNKDLIFFFTKLGLLIKEKNGYVYPACEQASTVLDVLRFALDKSKVNTITEAEVVKAEKAGDEFVVTLKDGLKYSFDRLVISTGGKAGLSTKEQVNGYDLVKGFGHDVTPLYPALTQLKCEGINFKSVSGVRSECILYLFVDDELVMTQRGELQFTDYGLSGIVSMQVSHYAAECLDAGRNVAAVLDLIPDFEEQELTNFVISKYLLAEDDETCEEFFTGLLNKKLNTEIIKLNGMKPSEPILKYDKDSVVKAVLSVKELVVRVTGTNGFDQAQVTGGGVPTSDVTETLESKKVSGLYITGELVNVDGICGGYNLQWAFTSGALAGNAAALDGESDASC